MAVLSDAKNVVIGVSHGESLPIPAPDDLELLKTVRKPLEGIGTRIADLVIFGSGERYSIRESSAYDL